MQTARESEPDRERAVAYVTRPSYRSHTRAPLRPIALLRPRVNVAPDVHAQAAAGRREFECAVLPHQGALHASARRLTKSRADADDLLQETLLRAWRFWPRYRERDHCRAWLQRILTNTFCSMCRSATRRRVQLSQLALAHVDEPASALPARADAQNSELSNDDQLASSLAALKPEQRRILCLIDVNERSYREAALELACPIGTVMSRLHRARRALRTQLAADAARA